MNVLTTMTDIAKTTIMSVIIVVAMGIRVEIAQIAHTGDVKCMVAQHDTTISRVPSITGFLVSYAPLTEFFIELFISLKWSSLNRMPISFIQNLCTHRNDNTGNGGTDFTDICHLSISCSQHHGEGGCVHPEGHCRRCLGGVR